MINKNDNIGSGSEVIGTSIGSIKSSIINSIGSYIPYIGIGIIVIIMLKRKGKI